MLVPEAAGVLWALGLVVTAATLALVAGANTPGAGAGGVARSLLDPLSLVKWSVWNLAVYQLALGVVALTLFPLALWSMLRSTVERERATGVALATSASAILLSLAAVSTRTVVRQGLGPDAELPLHPAVAGEGS